MAPFLPRVPQSPTLPGTSPNLWRENISPRRTLADPALGSGSQPSTLGNTLSNPHPQSPGQLTKRTGAPGDVTLQRSPDSPLGCPRDSPERETDRKGHVTAGGRARTRTQVSRLFIQRSFPAPPLGTMVGHPVTLRSGQEVVRVGAKNKRAVRLSSVRGARHPLPLPSAQWGLGPKAKGLGGERSRRAPKRPRETHIQSPGPVLGHVFAEGLCPFSPSAPALCSSWAGPRLSS